MISHVTNDNNANMAINATSETKISTIIAITSAISSDDCPAINSLISISSNVKPGSISIVVNAPTREERKNNARTKLITTRIKRKIERLRPRIMPRNAPHNTIKIVPTNRLVAIIAIISIFPSIKTFS